MPGESENRFSFTLAALSTCGRAIRYHRLFQLATSLLLLLPISLQAADSFTTVDLGKALNTEHAKAFTETIGFDTWFAQPQVTLHGIPFTLTTGRADLVRLPPGGRVEFGLPVFEHGQDAFPLSRQTEILADSAFNSSIAISPTTPPITPLYTPCIPPLSI
jgi:hypothetical protein